MTRRPERTLERLDFFDGARLLATDLVDSIGYEERLLALHVRGPHETWGVAEGLRLALSGDARRVTVSAGVAFDSRGRVLQLRSPTELGPDTMPPGTLVDVVLGRRGARWEAASTAGALGASVRLGDDVPLGRFARLQGGTLGGPDYRIRRSAHPFSRVRVRGGLTSAGELQWLKGNSSLYTQVDTTAAELAGSPQYLGVLAAVPALGAGVVGPFLSIATPTAAGFRARLGFVAVPARNLEPLLDDMLTRVSGVRIAWIGWERLSGCEG